MMEQSLHFNILFFNCSFNCSYVQVVILIALLHSPPFHASVNKDFIYLMSSYIQINSANYVSTCAKLYM